MELDDLLDLNAAAAELGIEPVTLRAAAGRGRLAAVKIGGVWITTRQEVDRYRRENLGRVGRPAGSFTMDAVLAHTGKLLEQQRRPFEDVTGKPGEPNVLQGVGPEPKLTKGRVDPTTRR